MALNGPEMAKWRTFRCEDILDRRATVDIISWPGKMVKLSYIQIYLIITVSIVPILIFGVVTERVLSGSQEV